jgi:hypothetical protein
MRNQAIRILLVFAGAVLLSLPTVAQVYYPGGRSPEQKKAAEASKATLKYDPHDLSGIWTHSGRPAELPKIPGIGDGRPSQLMGGAIPPPLTFYGLGMFTNNKPSLETSWKSRRTIPAMGNDPVGSCDPLGYPRAIERSAIQFFQTASKVLQVSRGTGYAQSVRDILIGNENPATMAEELGPRWDGWAVAHWEGDSFIVDSTGYDERTWLDGNGWPHSEDMKIHEVWHRTDATTLELVMTIDDPKVYTKTWVGNKQMFKLELPADKTVLYEELCVPSEEQEFNRGVRNPAGGDLQHSRALQ